MNASLRHRLLTLLAPLALGATLSACAGLPPSSDSLAGTPVVRFGQAAPADRSFVLHYPAGTPLPVRLSISGSLLQQGAEAQPTVTLTRDIYLYGPWASWDGKTWEAGEKLVKSHLTLTLPGQKTGQEAGELSARFDLR